MSAIAARSTRRSAPNAPSSSSIDQSDPFASLDPTLHTATATLASANIDPSLSNEQSRLNEFAQHVIKGGRTDEDAASLLAFSTGDEGMFEPAEAHQGFNELMEAAERTHQELTDQEANGTEEQAQPEQGAGRPDDLPKSQRLPQGPRGRKRKSREDGEETEESARLKKDSHKEVERRRRENINDGITEIAKHVPGGCEKMGKGTFLQRAAQYMEEIAARANVHDAELAKKEQERASAQADLAHVQAQLAEEQARALRLEKSYKEADDRAAQTQFQLSIAKTELDEVKKQLEQTRAELSKRR